MLAHGHFVVMAESSPAQKVVNGERQMTSSSHFELFEVEGVSGG